MVAKVYGVFCDDIRDEASGKQIIIGVYGAEMFVPPLPINLQLSLWVRVQGIDPGNHSFSIKIIGPSGPTPIVAEGNLDHPRVEALGNINMVGFPVTVSEFGRLSASFQLDDDEEIELANLIISPLPAEASSSDTVS